ncbi:MAG: 30S ribosomal protein S12 methylthiotransferase RimO [Desulfobacteraceae bacterium]
MKIYLESLGCCRNQIDSEVMLGRLADRGHEICDDPSRAEGIIVNTCGFISAASQEAVDTILGLADYKISGHCRKLVVTGCLVERFKNDCLGESLPEVDAFIGTGAVDSIVQALEYNGIKPLCLFFDVLKREFQGYPLPRQLSLDYSAYLKVSEGCSRKCTYCIIPRLRGIQRSRPAEDIVNEAEYLFSKGVKEIVLVGENTTDYGSDLQKKTDLSDILEKISKKAADIYRDDPVWIRLLYTHPASLNKNIIQTISQFDNICSYYDIPVQHASDSVLKHMGRSYSKKTLLSLFEDIRQYDPNAALRTTIITGFPGETEADFQTLLSFIKKVEFDHLGVFTYSDSQDLKSHGLNNHVSKELATQRHDMVMAEQAEISERINEKHLGKIYKVLVEEHPGDGMYIGRTDFQAPEVDGITFIYKENLEPGSFVDVKITETYAYDLAGEIV